MVMKVKAILGILLIIIFVSGCSSFFGHKTADIYEENNEVAKVPTDYVECPLDGELVSAASLANRIIAVTVENSPQARPQSGLREAELIYEVLAEGGITRFLVLYLHNKPEQIGPVRSARPYFLTISKEYDAVYFHAGGSPEALNLIRQEKYPAINEFSNGQFFWRSKDRKPPHNLYTSISKAQEAIEKKGFLPSTEILPRNIFCEKSQLQGKKATNFSLRYSKDYTVRYTYNPQKGVYLRYIGEKPHIDALTGEQLTAKNVLVQFASTKVLDADGRLEISLVGIGKGILFQAGKSCEISWIKKSDDSPTQFFDSEGKRIELLCGQTYIQIMPVGALVEITE